MRNIIAVLGITVVTLAGFAGVASADTSVYNRYETKHTYGGFEKTTGHINIQTDIEAVTNSQSIKVETK